MCAHGHAYDAAVRVRGIGTQGWCSPSSVATAHQVPGLTVRAHLQETLDVCDVALAGRSEQRRVPTRVPPMCRKQGRCG